MFVERLRSRVSIIRYPLYPNKSRTNTGVVVLLRRAKHAIRDAKSRPYLTTGLSFSFSFLLESPTSN